MASIVKGLPQKSTPLGAKFQIFPAVVEVHQQNLKTEPNNVYFDTTRGVLLSLIPAILFQTPACKDTVVCTPQSALTEVVEQSRDRQWLCHIEDEATLKSGWENDVRSAYWTAVQLRLRKHTDEKGWGFVRIHQNLAREPRRRLRVDKFLLLGARVLHSGGRVQW